MKKRTQNTIIKGPALPPNPFRLSLNTLRRYVPGEGNPMYGDSFVTRSAIVNWSTDIAGSDAEIRKLERNEGPFTLSGGPREMTVSIGECAAGPMNGHDLEISVEFACPMLGRQRARGPITIEQALWFEEAVRAAFEAARQTGLLPMPEKNRKRA